MGLSLVGLTALTALSSEISSLRCLVTLKLENLPGVTNVNAFVELKGASRFGVGQS